MNERQKEMVAHALGLPAHPWRKGARAKRWAYRIHFAAGPVDEPLWRDLVAKGFAIVRRCEHVAEPLFMVTAKGAEEAGLLARVPVSMRIKTAA